MPRGMRRGHQVGQGRVRLQRMDLVEIEELGWREVCVGPLSQGGTAQHTLQLGVETLPVGLWQVGQQQAHRVHPLRQLVHGNVGMVLENNLDTGAVCILDRRKIRKG